MAVDSAIIKFLKWAFLKSTISKQKPKLSPPPTVHGGDIIATARSLGCGIADLMDMSGNLSPLGPDPLLLEFLGNHLNEIGFLPEAASNELRSVFATRYNRKTADVLAGSGTTEFIFSIPQAVAPERALVIAPTYSDYQKACRMAGVPVEFFHLAEEAAFVADLAGLEAAIRQDDLVFICNPNNPTGQLISSLALHELAGRHPEATFVIDESYIAFCTEHSLLHLPPQGNLFILSSFSKAYGIPGLRLGFLSGSPLHLESIQKKGRPWGVNRLAQLAGLYLLQHEAQIRSQLLSFVENERSSFSRRLAELPGVTPFQSAAHFILCRLDGPVDAEQLRMRLLEKRIMIRNCANFTGLDQRFFRINLRRPEENARFFTEIQTILHS